MLIKRFNLKEGKVYSIVGLSKNSGKTTTLNTILKEIYNSKKTASVLTIGIDGEKKDSVFLHPKPEIILYPDFFVATAKISFKNNPFPFNIIKNTHINTIYGDIYIAKSTIKSKIELVGTGNLNNVIKIVSNLKNISDYILVDGAFDRLSSASTLLCDGFVLAISSSQYKSLYEFETAIKDLSQKIYLNNTLLENKNLLLNKNILSNKNLLLQKNSLLNNNNNIKSNVLMNNKLMMNNIKFVNNDLNFYISEFRNIFLNPDNINNIIFVFKTIFNKNDSYLNNYLTNTLKNHNLNFKEIKTINGHSFIQIDSDSLINIKDYLKKNLQLLFENNLVGIYTPGAITESITDLFYNSKNSKKDFFIFILDFTKFFIDKNIYKRLNKINIKIYPIFFSELKGITISSFHTNKNIFSLSNPVTLKNVVKKYFKDIEIVDIYLDYKF